MKRSLNKFMGADDLYQTSKSIVKVSVQTKGGKTTEFKKYYPKTSANLKDAKSIWGPLPRR